MLNKDNFKLGVLFGLITTMIVFGVLYAIKFSSYPFNEFLTVFSREARLITFFSAWCLVGNIALFTLFINTNKYKTGKGVFLVTVLYGLGFLLLKVMH